MNVLVGEGVSKPKVGCLNSLRMEKGKGEVDIHTFDESLQHGDVIRKQRHKGKRYYHILQ